MRTRVLILGALPREGLNGPWVALGARTWSLTPDEAHVGKCCILLDDGSGPPLRVPIASTDEVRVSGRRAKFVIEEDFDVDHRIKIELKEAMV